MQSMLPSIYSSKTTAQHRAPKNAHTHHGKSSSKNLAILFRAHRITDCTTLPSIYTGALRAAAVRNRSDNSDEFFLRSRAHAGRRLHEYIYNATLRASLSARLPPAAQRRVGDIRSGVLLSEAAEKMSERFFRYRMPLYAEREREREGERLQ